MKAKKPANSTLDAWWRRAVRIRWNGRCALCGADGDECHHMVRKWRWSTRWEPLDGVLLCVSCHSRYHAGELGVSRQLYMVVPHLALDKLSRKLKPDVLREAGQSENEWRAARLVELKRVAGG